MANDLADAVYGCVIGGAIGDALGAPVEGWYYDQIRAEHGRLEEFIPTLKGNTGDHYGETRGQPGTPGAITDDSTLRHYLCLAIIARGGRITPDDFAQVWLDKLNPDRFWTNERIVLHKLRIGMSPWDSGRGTPPAGCATIAIAPVGIINAGDPRAAYVDGFLIASVNQDDVNRDAAATAAAGVAAAFAPGAEVGDVLEAMTTHSSFVVKRALSIGMDLARDSDDVEQFAHKFYSQMLDWTWPQPPGRGEWNKDNYFSGSSLEIVPAVAAILYLCRGDVNECIIEGANFGRDCDTISSLAGSIAGALRGAQAIRPDWVRDCEKANESFFQEVEGDPKANFASVAERMVEALRQQSHSARTRAQQLEQLLG